MARDPWEELAEELVHGSEEEFVAALTERMMQLLVEGCENPDEFAAIASRAREAALGVWAEHSREVTTETEAAFMEALSAEQEVLEATLAEAFGEVPGLTARGQNEVNQAARGMSEILGRQNVALADNLADEWWEATSDAVTRIQLGDALEDVVRDGARRLADAGIETIDYKSGARTSVDAAVRRHAITQQNQCRNDMLVRECHEYGVDLVFTSAHYGARPEHAAWQGKPYGLDGPCEVDGVKYEGLAEATGYGTVAGLAGANCRHRIHPYVPGITKLPDTDFAAFEAKYHMSSDEYYEATQKQRAMERQIRQTKREIALGEAHGADMTEDRYRLGAQQKRLREHCARTGLPRDYAREQAYAAADKDGTGISIFHQPTALSSQQRLVVEERRLINTKAQGTAYDVNRRAVNGSSYEEKYLALPITKRSARQAHAEAGRIFRECDGTAHECLSVISWRTGKRVLDSFDHPPLNHKSYLTPAESRKMRLVKGGVVLIHNHPGSSLPSFSDIKRLETDRCVKASLVACHDGTVYCISQVKDGIIDRYEELCRIISDANPNISDMREIEMMATEQLYKENEQNRWFRITKK